MLKTALITGASSGIGYHLARLFAQDGHRLILVSRTESDLQKVADELATEFKCPKPVVMAKDLSKLGAAQEIFNDTEQLGFQVDYLVNDAGMGEWGLFNDNAPEQVEAMVMTNVLSFMWLTKLYLSGMLKRNEGRILQIGSLMGFYPTPLLAVYAATKAFQTSLTDALINEIKDSNVTMTLLVPGHTDTGFYNAENGLDTTRGGKAAPVVGDDPKDVAYNGYTALIKGDHRAYGTAKVRLLVGASGILPNEILSTITRTSLEKDDK